LLGEGENAKVYRIDVDHKPYALHLFKENPDSAMGSMFDIPGWYGGQERYFAVLTLQKAVAMAQGVGVDGLAQLAGYQPREGVCVSQLASGKRIQHLTAEDVSYITPLHQRGYVRTLAAMRERGLYVDPNAGNVLWDPKAGFTIVDYHRGEQSDANTQLSMELVVSAMLAEGTTLGDDWLQPSAEKAAAVSEASIRSLRSAARYHLGIHVPTTIEDINTQKQWRRRSANNYR
jgi:hypothetical protein